MRYFVFAILIVFSVFQAQADDRAQALYNSFTGTESNIGFVNSQTGTPRVGISVREKSEDGIFCRKSAPVVPRPQYSFDCFVAMRYTAAQMHGFYIGVRTGEERLSVTDSQGHIPVDGPAIYEKSAQTYLCQKQVPIVGAFPVTHLCYRNLAWVK